jgi:hypothetical protein
MAAAGRPAIDHQAARSHRAPPTLPRSRATVRRRRERHSRPGHGTAVRPSGARAAADYLCPASSYLCPVSRLPVPRLRFLTSPSGITIPPRNHPASRHAGTSSRLLPALRHIEPAGSDGQTRRPHAQPTGANVTGQGTGSLSAAASPSPISVPPRLATGCRPPRPGVLATAGCSQMMRRTPRPTPAGRLASQ